LDCFSDSTGNILIDNEDDVFVDDDIDDDDATTGKYFNKVFV
jgi:hypothetical protein